MGSQLTKTSGSHQHQQPSTSSSTSNYQSLRTSPIRVSRFSHHNRKSVPIPKNIIVVNRGPDYPDPNNPVDAKSSVVKLPPEPLLKPLIPFGQSLTNLLSGDQPRLLVKPVVEIGRLFDQNLRFAAETVSTEQQKIIERIRLVEQQSGKLSQQYYQEKQRRFNKAVENFGKFDEIRLLLDRCESDIEQLLTTFAKLNSALPESLCLENFQPPC